VIVFTIVLNDPYVPKTNLLYVKLFSCPVFGIYKCRHFKFGMQIDMAKMGAPKLKRSCG